MIRVVVIDDDPLVTESLKTILEVSEEIKVLGTGHSATEAVTLYLQERPDVLLTDIRMGQSTGIAAAKEIFKQVPEAIILLLTTFSDDEYICEALQIGVKGYLIKQDLASIVPAIKAVYNGQTVFGTEIAGKLASILTDHSPRKSAPVQLTERQESILIAVASGKNNKEIAQELFLSEGTVRNNISQLLEKLAVRDRTQLAIFYYQEYK
ncbi:response regulator transcription factor [Enterococcus pseudoavium]|uniref:Response regulator transcription factor n=1 Tax=Enterococcus pseudoavium TaxID=44007 RepID=A0AAE4KW58_9ENTE|nr:response regulator transcription factor [Enterococcus pseudoavium]MDT2736265.1 response regulator transcription factor [Enterococcus pseudoavium]MDT2753412.1 response regulator transcription factor [Enterococcus pseudoavium]MDT2770631.1 response regulator transcription factor [Enterococcus pseudoavium]